MCFGKKKQFGSITKLEKLENCTVDLRRQEPLGAAVTGSAITVGAERGSVLRAMGEEGRKEAALRHPVDLVAVGDPPRDGEKACLKRYERCKGGHIL